MSVTVNVASPSALVTPWTVTTDEEPPSGFSATVLPDSASPSASDSTTVIVAAVDPSAGTWVGEPTTVESATTGATGAGVPNVTVASCPARKRLSVVSVAVYATISLAVSVTENVACPMAFVVGALLCLRVVDLYWLAAPNFDQGGFHLHWLDLAAPLGLGGIWLAAFLWQLKQRPLFPLHDPTLEEVLEHGRE